MASFIRRFGSLLGALIAAPVYVAAEPTQYGAFKHFSELPQVLFLTGEISSNESFELRRAMRDQQIEMVVTASPGGNLYEGLQIAAIIHDNGLGTFVPAGASCESSCANIFLGGSSRMVVGELGVHQFYSGSSDADQAAPQDVTTAVAQYTTADIIGIMNQFGTPPFVYEKMFGTTDIYYFRPSEKPRLNARTEDAAFVRNVEEVEALVSRVSDALARPDGAPIAEGALAETVPDTAPEPSLDIEQAAIELLVSINADWSLPNHVAVPRVSAYYGPTVDFYGSDMSLDQVIQEKRKFADRWPIRSYSMDPESVRVDCIRNGCRVDSVINWYASSPERGAEASGSSTWSLLLVSVAGKLLIAAEDGETLKRN